LRDFFIGLATGVVLCGLVAVYMVVRQTPAVRRAQDQTAAALHNAVSVLEAKLDAWQLRPADIERELTQTGKVVRRHVSEFGIAVADAAGDAAITARIKARFALDKELDALGIGVTTTDGRVTLTGNVSNPRQISRAMMLALETEGVREVASTLRVKPAATAPR
jgi:osmotically-inducible protein OsmY